MNDLERINLRLSPEMFQAIASARSKRPGNVSCNTWIAEAIEEKLAREPRATPLETNQGGGHA